jgi:undecaprenyl-diphosphatase
LVAVAEDAAAVDDATQLVAPGFLAACILGVVEGVTEFLPVSSTGHLIVANRLLGQSDSTFEVGIQAGAITAIVVLYWRRLIAAARSMLAGGSSWASNLLVLIVTAAIPAIVLGLLLDDFLDAHLFRPSVVATTMVVGGVLLLVLEAWLRRRSTARSEIGALTPRSAVVVGLFQCLALIPGTSRSGATIAGGLLCGLSRVAAAEFSFLLGLPILYGACALKLWKAKDVIDGQYAIDLSIGAIVSFVTAIAVVVPFVRFLQRHTFAPFAHYRILGGIALACLIWFRVIPA